MVSGLRKRWRLHQRELLPCYDIPGLPQDNLQLESLFEHLRRRQRRTSGRKSTRELRDFAQAQILFQAQSEAALLEQIRQVPLADYYSCQSRLRLAERPRQFLQALHHDPLATMNRLVKQYLSCCATPATGRSSKQPPAPMQFILIKHGRASKPRIWGAKAFVSGSFFFQKTNICKKRAAAPCRIPVRKMVVL